MSATHELQSSDTFPYVHNLLNTPGDSSEHTVDGSPTCHRNSGLQSFMSDSQPLPMKPIGGRVTRKDAIDWLALLASKFCVIALF